MTAGLDELERWLGDLVRQGLAGARRQPYAFWDAMAARLVDAQMPGLAERVARRRAAPSSPATTGPTTCSPSAAAGSWPSQAWRRRDTTSTTTLRRRPAGVPRLAPPGRRGRRRSPGCADRWVVAGVRQGDDGRIVSQRTWLWGEETGRWVLLLDFAAAGAALRVAQPVGSVVDDELTLHPGSRPAPGRARAASTRSSATGARAGRDDASPPPSTSWRPGWPPTRGATGCPWPSPTSSLVDDGGRWWLQDAAGDRLPARAGGRAVAAARAVRRPARRPSSPSGRPALVHPLAVARGAPGEACMPVPL